MGEVSGGRRCENLVGGKWCAPESSAELSIRSPWNGTEIARLAPSGAKDVERVVSAAKAAAVTWAATPLKDRVRPLARFYERMTQCANELAALASSESGKTPSEALAGIQRGLEVVEFALGIPNLDRGSTLEVSRGVTCEYRREPLGVVLGITPFNFPAMVPMWMFPIALTLGNAFVLKPSEKVPLTACRMAELLVEAGYADGLFSVVQGNVSTVEALVDHPGIEAVGFVGSSGAAHSVYARATALGKRALCLGGAKNQLLVAPDADADLTVKAVVDSFTGCAGQRCMAMSVLVVVGDAARLIEPIVERAGRIRLGSEMGALIDSAAHARLTRGIARALAQGATLRLDGREQSPPAGCEGGNWLGPTVLDQVTPAMDCAHDELFGPVLSIVRVDTLDEALALERASRYGNATSIFTRSGAVARYVAERATSGMVGVNVGVPVPRDPFSFGGRKDSKFGPGDLTGPGGIEFWSNLKKITTKWALAEDNNWMS